MQLLSNGNKKYRYRKDLKVLTFGLPPIETCPGAGECKKFCYAKAGRMLMPSATQAMARRFEASKRDDFVERMADELSRRSWTAIRIHDSGDFYSAGYLRKWCEIAKRCDDKLFFAYTKMVPLVKMLESWIPSNLKIIYSFGGKFDNQINIRKDNHARVFTTQADMDRAGYKLSPDNLPLSFHGNYRREGFVYHGVKKWVNCGVK